LNQRLGQFNEERNQEGGNRFGIAQLCQIQTTFKMNQKNTKLNFIVWNQTKEKRID
jgi:hypothetical protein